MWTGLRVNFIGQCFVFMNIHPAWHSNIALTNNMSLGAGLYVWPTNERQIIVQKPVQKPLLLNLLMLLTQKKMHFICKLFIFHVNKVYWRHTKCTVETQPQSTHMQSTFVSSVRSIADFFWSPRFPLLLHSSLSTTPPLSLPLFSPQELLMD